MLQRLWAQQSIKYTHTTHTCIFILSSHQYFVTWGHNTKINNPKVIHQYIILFKSVQGCNSITVNEYVDAYVHTYVLVVVAAKHNANNVLSYVMNVSFYSCQNNSSCIMYLYNVRDGTSSKDIPGCTCTRMSCTVNGSGAMGGVRALHYY